MTDWADWQRRWGQSHVCALAPSGADLLRGLPNIADASWALGWRRCYRMEDVPTDEAQALADRWRERGAFAAARQTSYASGHPGSVNRRAGQALTGVWLAHTREDLSLALALDQQERTGIDAQARSDATRALGALLGYPVCCTDAFLQLRDRGDNDNWWRQLAMSSAPGQLSCVVNPMDVLDRLYLWYPCSYHCPATRAFGRRWLQHLSEVNPAAAGLVEATIRVQVLVTEQGRRLWFGADDAAWWLAERDTPDADAAAWADALLGGALLPASALWQVVRADGAQAWLLDFRGDP